MGANTTQRADAYYPLQGEYGWDDQNIIANGISNVSLAANTIGSGQLAPSLLQFATVPLTAANIIAMYTTPVLVIAAPGTGKSIVIRDCLFRMTATSTAFTSGGTFGLQYDTTAHNAGTLATWTGAAALITASAGVADCQLGMAAGAASVVVPQNKGIYISNATGVFATGTGTAVLYVSYYVV
jgi:hypothetical protein